MNTCLPFKRLVRLSFFSFCAVLIACSSNDEQTPADDGQKVRQLTIAEVPITRATLTDKTSTIGAAWVAGDMATWFNVSTFTNTLMQFGHLTARSTGATSAFTGNITGEPAKGHKLALFYPATDPITSGNDRGKFTINLAGQNGTLDYIQQHCHYVYGVAEVETVTETTVSASISEMKSLLALCKFTFKDGSNNLIPVNTLTISYGDDETVGFPQTYVVEPKNNLADVFVPSNLSPVETPLTINLGTGVERTSVYVALFPINEMPLFFSVTNSSGTYTGTATATLEAGKFYAAELKLN